MAGTLHRILHPLILAAALAFVPVAALAQKVLVSQGDLRLYDLESGRFEWSQPGPQVPWTGAVITADGRYAVSTSFAAATPAVRIVDLAAGSSVDVPLSFDPHIAHPRATAVFGLTGGPLSFGSMTRGTLARLDLGGLTTYGGCAAGTVTRVDLSGDGRALFALCESGDLAVLDADSGAVLRTLPLGQGVTFAASFDGTALVAARPAGVELLDATTGAVLGSTVVPGPVGCLPSVGQRSRDRTTLVVTCLFIAAPSVSWSSHVLQAPALTWGAALGLERSVVSLSPDNRMAFSTYVHRTGANGNVQIHDLASGSVTISVPIIAGIQVSYAPLAPTASATVTGGQVDVAWTLPPASTAVTGYLVEVGSAPGLSDVGTAATGIQATLTVPSTPSGRYYVRVRAENASGRSAPSDEIVVAVP